MIVTYSDMTKDLCDGGYSAQIWRRLGPENLTWLKVSQVDFTAATLSSKRSQHAQKSMLRDRTDRPGLVAFYDIRPGNGAGLFSQPRSPHGARCPVYNNAIQHEKLLSRAILW